VAIFGRTRLILCNVASSLKSVFGRELGQEYAETVAFGSLEAVHRFCGEECYLPVDQRDRNLAVQVINVPAIKVSVFKIFEKQHPSLSSARCELGFIYMKMTSIMNSMAILSMRITAGRYSLNRYRPVRCRVQAIMLS
jgi:hypothetical protein